MKMILTPPFFFFPKKKKCRLPKKKKGSLVRMVTKGKTESLASSAESRAPLRLHGSRQSVGRGFKSP